VDALTQRLVFSTFTPEARKHVISVANVDPNKPVDANTSVNPSFNGAIKAVVRTILASPQQHLR
jgi:hypothetical protein